MIDQHRQAFKDEAYELLTELESSLLELEENPADSELIGRVFRAMHTIKGSGAMFGFETIAAFTHEVETVFDLVRSGRLSVSQNLVDLSLAARDRIKAMLDGDGVDPDTAASEELIAGFKALSGGGETHETNDSPGLADQPPAPETSGQVTYRIRFKPFAGLFMTGTNPMSLLNELRGLGRTNVVAQMANLPALSDLEPESCYLYWDIILTTNRGENAIRDVFIFVEDDCDLTIDMIDDGGQLDVDQDYKKLGDILVERGELRTEDMEMLLSRHRRFGELAVDAGLVKAEQVASALVEQQHVREVRQERQVQESASSIRVPAEKLDVLVNLVGELVTVQARLTQLAQSTKQADLLAISEEVERLTADLRDNALNIRMLPIGTTFSKFKRLVRDLSQELGKEIEMTTEGADTELDKTVIEKLNDPLVHLIRNSIDHGIEAPDKREQAGKPRQGTVHLTAVHSGDSVLITIKDDGGGLDREAIHAKAVEKGLLAATAELSDKEIFAQIFEPGFSTAKQVTSVSGRGVGMDVVKRAIEALRGTINIDSKKGVGTTITVKLPLTLAIIESLLVRIGPDCFVIPLALVNECVELTREDIENSHGRNIANVRGRIVPYVPLREQFYMQGERPDIEQIVITTVESHQVGFVVDHVIGEHQTVIKSLGRAYKNIDGISGATILGDGSVALILDIPHLIRRVEALERRVEAA